jgi:SAM-dependent methyltransferase
MNGSKLISESPLYVHDPVVHNFSAARQILPYILKLKPIKSIVDIGCGTGTWLSVAKEFGVEEILGVDGVNLDQEELKIPRTNFINANLSQKFNLNKNFDLLICLEVAEHLPESSSNILIDTLTNHSDFILFSAAIPSQGGQNHINEQWPEYWSDRFSAKGYFACNILRDKFWDNEEIEWWYRQNMVIYGKKFTLSSLNLPISEKIYPIIHPALFKEKLEKISELNALIKKEVLNPSLKRSLKSLYKSIFK